MKDTCKIAVDISRLERDGRGMGFFLREFLAHLSQIHPAGCEFALIAKGRTVAENLPFRTVEEREIDASWIVWFPFNHPTFSPPCSFVVTIHDLAPFAFPQGEKKLQKKYIEGGKKAKKILVDSQFTRSEAEKFLKVPADRLAVIPPGFDPAWPHPENFDLPSPYILAVGPAEPRKNFRMLLKAFSRLKKQNFPHKLVVVGDLPPWPRRFGPVSLEEKNPLPRLAGKLKLREHVLFPGRVSRPALARWYACASLVAVPSLYEGFGFPILEAYSQGVPVACSRIASLPEVAGDGAFFFNPTNPDEMAAVFYHALTDSRAVEQKQKLAEKQLGIFKWENCIKKYLEVFQTASMS